MNTKQVLVVLLMLAVCSKSMAQEYPFDLPSNMTATIDINTTEQEAFNNLLLGVNTHDLAHSDGQELVRETDPITIRFPHGLFSNWYDWEQDKARLYGGENVTYTRSDGTSRTVEVSYLSSIQTMDSHNLYVGIDALNALNNERKAATGKGYDMMWTFNMSADGSDFDNGSPVSVARYQDLINRGFEVKAIEMGNENFYAGQRSTIIPNHSDYIARAKSMYAALKALNPDLKLSVPLERKSIPANTGWNTDLTQNGTDYFDAVSVHTYVGADPDDPANGDEAFATALIAREVLRKTIDDYSRVVAPDKPIWLTEWGVKSGGPNAVSALGMADCYMFMSENQDTYERANWFSVNGKLNSHLVWQSVNGKLVIKEPLEKTSYGSTFEIVRSVYENSTLLGSEMTVPTLEGKVNAVNARAVKKDGKTTIFAINLSNQEVPFTINIDGHRFYGEFEHKAFAFSSMDDEISVPFHTDPLQLVKEGRGGIYLPQYSINTIELKNEETLALDFVDLENGEEIDKGRNLSVHAAVSEDFVEVSLYVNDTLLSTQTIAPYVWSSFPQLMHMMSPSYRLKLVGKLQNDEQIERQITIKTPEQWAFADNFLPHPIPGKIEAEHYDYGGENIAYYDKSAQNTSSYSYRGYDKVDLGSGGKWLKYIQGGEWLEYSVEVKRSGSYDIAVKHQTRRTPEFEAMTFSFQDQGKALFSGLKCTSTGSDTTSVDTFSTAYLDKGRHILRLDILGYGYDMDYFEFILTSLPIDYHNVGTLNDLHNPDSYDEGSVLEHLQVPQDSLGFEFAGWFTDATYTDTIPEPAISVGDDKNLNFYAKWHPMTLAGTVAIYGKIVEGETLNVDTSSIENNSGQFYYQWQKSTGDAFTDIPGATNSSYVLDNTIVGNRLRVQISSSLQLGMVVSKPTNAILSTTDQYYTVSYDSNGGMDGEITSEIVGVGGFPTFTAQPTREGYVLSQWINERGDTLVEQSTIISDTTLFATWEVKNTYTVRFTKGDRWVDVMTEKYPARIITFPDEPIQTDSVFVKWITVSGERFDDRYLVFSDMEVFPVWQLKRFSLNVISLNGRIDYFPQQPDYVIHSNVELKVTPGDRYEFTGWSGDYVGNDTVLTVTMDSAINLIANYIIKPYYALDVYFSKGSVTKFPNSSRYLSGESVVLTATPASGYTFDAWSGDYIGTENPLILVMSEDMEIYANFKLETDLKSTRKQAIRCYPNPNNGSFSISIDSDENVRYKIVSLAGVEIQSGRFKSELRVHLENQPGVYILQLAQNQTKVTKRIIVNP